MNVKPQFRLIFLALLVLIQFFLIITYSNSLAGKNVELTQIQTDISKENRSQGEYRETIAQQLNEKIVSDSRSENISRISPDQSIKLRDLQPADDNQPTTPSGQPKQQTIVVF